MDQCRICLQNKVENSVSLKDIAPFQHIPYEEVYCYVTNLSNFDRGPQLLCLNCTDELLAAYEFRRRCERNELLFEKEIPFVKVEVDENVKLEVETKVEVNEGDDLPESTSALQKEEKTCQNENLSQLNLTEVPANIQVEKIKSGKKKATHRKALKQKCTDCGRIFHNTSNLNRHKKAVHNPERQQKRLESKNESVNDESIQCAFCSVTFKYNNSRIYHCKLKHPEKIMKCTEDHCSFEYFLPYQISKHMMNIHGKSPKGAPYKCNECSKIFANNSNLRRHHQQAHTVHEPNEQKPEKIICNECGKILNPIYLYQHMKRAHGNKSETFVCDHCGFMSKTRIHLIDHMRRSHIKRHKLQSIKCRYCPEIFKNYAARHRHEIRFHTQAFRFNCHICGIQFMAAQALKLHMLVHTGDKNYVCTTCASRFRTPSALKRHLVSHTDEKPFVCSICQAAFKTRKSLRVHGNIHEERKYECPVCAQKFTLNQDMRKHVMRNHPEYELPPPGTVMNKVAKERMEKIELKKKMLSLVREKAE